MYILFFGNQNMKKLPSKAWQKLKKISLTAQTAKMEIHIEIRPKRYLFTCSVVKTINFKLVILKEYIITNLNLTLDKHVHNSTPCKG